MRQRLVLVAIIALTATSIRGAESPAAALATSARAATASWGGKVMTVAGLIPAEQMGVTLPHEHLLIVHAGPRIDLTDERLAGDELALFARAGGKTLVEMTNFGIGRRPAALKRISERTGVQIIMGCGYYKDKWLSFDMRAKSEQEIAADVIHDIVEGVDGVRAGVIGELGVSRPITSFESRQLRAAAIAQKATGAAINVHFDVGDSLESLSRGMDIIEKAGGDLSRVAISHFHAKPAAVDACAALAKRGCYVEFDLFGLEKAVSDFAQVPAQAAAALKSLIEKGHLQRILISQDLCFAACYTKNGGYGYAHLLKNVVPQLRANGITDDQIRTIMIENPRRLFAFQR